VLKHHAMKTKGRVEVKLHAFLTSAINESVFTPGDKSCKMIFSTSWCLQKLVTQRGNKQVIITSRILIQYLQISSVAVCWEAGSDCYCSTRSNTFTLSAARIQMPFLNSSVTSEETGITLISNLYFDSEM